MASQAIIANQRSLGGGGSGIKINASVLPVLPSSVTDGMIIVVSSTPANQFYFGYTMPPSPVAGDVWIQTIDTALGYPFLIGTVTLKPGATMQYTGREWEYRNAYIGLNGKWEIFSTFSPLSALTWEQISAISKSGGDLSRFFNVGDTKEIMVNSVAYDVRIIGFNHDLLEDRTNYAGLTFDFVNCWGETHVMNYDQTNSGGWPNTYVYKTVMPDIQSKIQTDLQNVIRPVIKLTSAGSKSTVINESIDTLFLPSEIELFGALNYSTAGEGTQYAGFSTNADRKKTVNGNEYGWFSRSPNVTSTAGFCAVSTSGTSTYIAANQSRGISPCFCV